MPTPTTIKRNITYAAVVETTEGVYAPPASAANFLQVLATGADLSGTKATLARNVFTGSIGEASPRVGESSVKVTLPVEARAFSVEGGRPEYDALMLSGIGGSRQNTTIVTTNVSGNTGSVLSIADADIAKFAVGDTIQIKESGAHWTTPITAVVTTVGAATITLLVPRATGVFPASVTIGKFTTYTLNDFVQPTLSISKYMDSTRLEQAVGCRVNSIALDSFATGKLPSFKFGMEGLNFGSSITARPFTPSYDAAPVPIILSAGVYQNGVALPINSLTLTMTNTIAFQSDVSQPNGKSAGRATNRNIKGTIDPYKSSVDVNQFTAFSASTPFTLFAFAHVPSATAGQYTNTIAIYLTNCVALDIKETDQNGLLVDTIAFQATRGTAGVLPEIFITMI